jgi:hypothetical protein
MRVDPCHLFRRESDFHGCYIFLNVSLTGLPIGWEPLHSVGGRAHSREPPQRS